MCKYLESEKGLLSIFISQQILCIFIPITQFNVIQCLLVQNDVINYLTLLVFL